MVLCEIYFESISPNRIVPILSSIVITGYFEVQNFHIVEIYSKSIRTKVHL
jgi:hypothetical protein